MDTSFLDVESHTAHMHVGWVAAFAPRAGESKPTFEALRDHVAARLGRVPRFRQRLAHVPLGLHMPVWVDEPDVDLDRHVLRSTLPRLEDVARLALSVPLQRDRPLWELWIADSLADGQIGVVAKAHHCMVDGIAATQLATLLVDAEPDTLATPPDGWEPARSPASLGLIAGAGRERLGQALAPLRGVARKAASPATVARDAERVGRALRDAFGSLARPSPLNVPLSPLRQLVPLRRSLTELRAIGRHHQVSFNDVVLVACAGGLRRFLERRGELPISLRTMVPVNLRRPGGDAGALGNRIGFVFVDLPCDVADPLERLRRVHAAMWERKRGGVADGAGAVTSCLGFAPAPVRRAVSRLAATPRTFNLTISNIPGPPVQLYLRGCPLEEAYPVVPLADGHALAIGVMTVAGEAFFGLHVDPKALPDADALADDINEGIDELLPLNGRPRPTERVQPGALLR
jgi:WS/DGAT/MGAT family acyltransferase